MAGNREALRGSLAKQGALLFRDCGISDVNEFYSLLETLEILDSATLQGVELIQMIRKGQVRPIPNASLIEQFNYLAM